MYKHYSPHGNSFHILLTCGERNKQRSVAGGLMFLTTKHQRIQRILSAAATVAAAIITARVGKGRHLASLTFIAYSSTRWGLQSLWHQTPAFFPFHHFRGLIPHQKTGNVIAEKAKNLQEAKLSLE